ncbi:MAG: hypothetical protein A2Z74_06475 [Chloroflexi bacterium RBG_13_46_9]|nr:MAG: hypothetical protein A2Z74_06475 [Chloroflexi bacterium RBG_13_46_9]
MNALLRRNHYSTPFNAKRGLVHLVVGLSIGIACFQLSRPVLLSILIPVTIAWLLTDILRMSFARLSVIFTVVFAPFLRDYEKSRLTGASFLLMGCSLSYVIFDKEIAALAISFLAVGDPLAHFVRDRLSKSRIVFQSAGEAAACFIACITIGLLWQHYANLTLDVITISIGAVTAAVVQSLSLPLDDNFTIPLCTSGLMWITQMLSG